MIRTTISAEMDVSRPTQGFTYTAEGERANRIRCAQEDLDAARREYVLRRSHIGRANKTKGFMAKADKSMAFVMFNKARAALARAEKALAKVEVA